MKILHLTLKKKWFDMIASGVKTEEYRDIKPYFDVRLNKSFDVVRFKHGYNKDAPKIDVELIEITTGKGRPEWGGTGEDVYIIKLGEIIKRDNTPKQSAPNIWSQATSKPLGHLS